MSSNDDVWRVQGDVNGDGTADLVLAETSPAAPPAS
jgi:hypothetical protein